MEFYVVAACEGGDGLDYGQGHEEAVEGVFEGDYRGGGVVDVGADDGGGGDVRECEVVVVCGCDGCDLGAGDRGDSAGFVDVDV